MAKTKRCPVCSARTKGNFWRSKRTNVFGNDGKQVFHPGGEPAFGLAMTRCSKCAWLGDFLISPPTSTHSAYLADDDDDDYDQDYINHYYH